MVAVGTVVFIFAGASPGLKRHRARDSEWCGAYIFLFGVSALYRSSTFFAGIRVAWTRFFQTSRPAQRK